MKVFIYFFFITILPSIVIAQCSTGCDRTNPSGLSLIIGTSETVCLTSDRAYLSIVIGSNGVLNICGANISAPFATINGSSGAINLYGGSTFSTGYYGNGSGSAISTDDCSLDGSVVFGGRPVDPSLYGCNALPVDFLEFTSMTESGLSTLYWQTAKEFNNCCFVVQRSNDLTNWLPIDTVKGQGSKMGLTDYHYQDLKSPSGTNYYRLIQYDFDGHQTISKVVYIDFFKAQGAVAIYPNPAQEAFSIYLGVDVPFSLEVLSSDGRRLFFEEELEGIEVFTKGIATYERGLYVVRLRTPDHVFTRQLLIR